MAKNSEIAVSFVDEGRHKIYLTVDGCPVTVSCTKEDNLDICETIKGILIGSMLDGSKSPPKFDKTKKK